VWRLCAAAYAKDALSGEGGLHAAGRWHEQGVRVAHAAATLSLAALEMLVRTDRAFAPRELAAVEIDVPDSVKVDRLAPEDLPRGWDAFPFPAATQALGMRWLASGRSAVLEVPSAVIPRERNYVIHPAHGDARRVKVVGTTPFSFDPRLLRR
jgi:RES domain-containing protein